VTRHRKPTRHAGRGPFRVAVADSDTAALAVGRHVWDVKRTDADQETMLAQGSLLSCP
jgi:hypothetical protein